MDVKRLIRTGALAGFLLLSIVGSTLASAPSDHSDAVGHVYVNDNTAGTNTVAGLDRHTDGSLTPIPGSPFVIGGAGTGTVTGSAGGLPPSRGESSPPPGLAPRHPRSCARRPSST